MRDIEANTVVQSHPLGFSPGRRSAYLCWVGLVSFLLYFIVYMMDVASFSFQPSNSPAKHYVMVGVAIFAFLLVPVQAISSVLIFFPLAFIYLLGNLPAYAVMIFIFAAAAPLLGYGIFKLTSTKSLTPLLFIVFLTLVPVTLALFLGELESIYSDYYGRPRLLLGYFHPKEAAACFSIPFFLYLFTQGTKKSFSAFILFSSFLWVVGSRNIALAMLLAVGLRFYPALTFILMVAGVISTASFLLIDRDLYYFIDELLSFRLTVWDNAVSESLQANVSEGLGGSRLSIDSFYVEVYSISGAAGLLVLTAWVIIFSLILLRNSSGGNWSFPMFIAILFFAGFDSGIASTGNIFHIFSWATILMLLFKDSAEKKFSRENLIYKFI